MEPIVSPWAFYALGLCGNLHQSSPIWGSIAILLLVGCAFAGIGGEVERERIKPFFKVGIALAIMSFICGALVPSRQDATMMLAASVVTPDNIAAVQGNIIDFVGKVAKAIADVEN